MRRILVDHARRHQAAKSGGSEEPVTLGQRLARVVELRFFAGLTEAETAELPGVTDRSSARASLTDLARQ